MFTDISKRDYPKTLMIRNSPGGMIWQVYHVHNKAEADRLASNANRNGFYGSTLEDYQPNREETWPDWRDTPGWEAQTQEAPDPATLADNANEFAMQG